MVEMGWLVLKLKISQVTDVAEKEIQEPILETGGLWRMDFVQFLW